jgi:hypothetical protein
MHRQAPPSVQQRGLWYTVFGNSQHTTVFGNFEYTTVFEHFE